MSTILELKEIELEPLLFGVKAAAKMLAISERTLWTITKNGELPTVKIGSRVLWPAEDLRAWVQSKKQIRKAEY